MPVNTHSASAVKLNKTWFPSMLLEPMNDELAYGLVCRTARRLGYSKLMPFFGLVIADKSPERSIRELLVQLWTAPINLPAHHVNDDLHCKSMDRFTLLPVYRPFDWILPYRCDANYFNPPKTLAYCPICREEQLDRYGVASWLRSHNVFGVSVCHTHEEPLLRPTAGRPLNSIVLPGDKTAVLKAGKRRPYSELRFAKTVSVLLKTSLDRLNHRTFSSYVSKIRAPLKHDSSQRKQDIQTYRSLREQVLHRISDGYSATPTPNAVHVLHWLLSAMDDVDEVMRLLNTVAYASAELPIVETENSVLGLAGDK